jgi:putative hydrolase of the HAD superfamily
VYTEKEKKNMAQAIKAVLFDFGRVLGHFDHMKACGALAAQTGGRMTGEDVRVALFDPKGLATMFERGELDARTFMRSVCTELEIMPFSDMHDFESLWGDIFTDAGMGPVLEGLKPFVHTGILSNTDPIHWSYIEKLPVLKHFDLSKHATLSFEAGLRKPEPGIYLEAAHRLGFTPQEIVYIDDISANVKAAQQLSFHAFQFDARSQSAAHLKSCLSTFGLMQ